MADVGADRRARLDAIARYLHDVAEDDAQTATLPLTIGWVLRSTRMEVSTFPVLGEDLVLHTYCSATASRWAERTTVVHGTQGARVAAASIWVAVDAQSGAPARLDEWFFALYGPSANGRRASARLALGGPDERTLEGALPWPLRRSDVDAWGHVNNAVAWAALEDAVEIGPSDAVAALVEHHAAIDPRTEVALASLLDGDEWSVWLLDPAAGANRSVLVASRVAIRPGGASVADR